MAESSKKPAAVSPYHEIKYNDPWYIDTEIPDLYEHLDVLQLALHKLDTETALLDSYTDEALQKISNYFCSKTMRSSKSNVTPKMFIWEIL